ncbi:hypothetical protein OAS43_01330 [Candidatus Pelagibacter sp.]|nr:hypothetical protein [Candidatus Pelagibacter sp.]
MLKFIIPAIVIFLTVLFWEKIANKIYEKFNIRVNYLIISVILLVMTIIILLINN